MKDKILGTGLSGLVGTRISQILSDRFEFTDLSYDTGVDITDREVVFSKVGQSRANWILHLAAKTDVDGCEAEKALGKDSNAWKVNVSGTQNIVSAGAKFGKKVLYVSTDFVFAGTKDSYSETDVPNPLNWYAQTKFEGEKLVLVNTQNLVMRIAYPYCARNGAKKDFVHTILDRLKAGQAVTAVSDQVFCPTLIDDIAKAVYVLIQNGARGIYHVVGGDSLTPFAAAMLIAREFGLDMSLISETTRDKFYQNRAVRPYKLHLEHVKITSLGVVMHTFLEGLKIIKEQGLG